MIPYIIQVAAFQLVFLMIYDAFLKKETFFNWNRLYLLVTAILSVIIPFIKLDVLKNSIPQQYIINLPEIFIGNGTLSSQNAIQLETVIIQSKSFWTWENILYLGITLAALLFAFKIAKVILMLIKNPKRKFGNLLIINLLNSNAAFSFFHYIFLGERLNEKDKDAILKHEMVHVKEKHTFDLLFFEVLRILFWFNPLVYMYQNRIMTLHEFIADQEATKHQDKSRYYQNLLSQVFQTQNISFINPFFKQSLIKKRIVMLQKSKSKQVKLLKYALLIPIVFGMLVYTSCEKEKEVDALDLEQYAFTQTKANQLNEDLKVKFENFTSFLIKNPEFVGWTQGVLKSGRTYSIHPISEKVPDNLVKVRKSVNGGEPFIMFMEFAAPPPPPPVAGETSKEVTVKEDYSNSGEVPFAVIEQVPLFPGCENLVSNEERKNCMSDKISKLIGENFNTSIAKENGITGRQRITALFKIGVDGTITDVQARAPHEALEQEAIRVINRLPKMQPGKQKGNAVVVPYALPIIFVAE
jgi:bla regulator protein BlaR1